MSNSKIGHESTLKKNEITDCEGQSDRINFSVAAVMTKIKKFIKNHSNLLRLWIIMSCLSVGILVLQTRRVIALFDFSYYTDIAVRINEGQLPYVDIPIFANPGSFVQLALVLRWFPSSYIAIFMMMAMQSTVCCALAIGIVKIKSKGLSVGKSVLLYVCVFPVGIVNIYSLFHQPYYDSDAIFWITAGIFCLTYIWSFKKQSNPSRLSSLLVGLVLGTPYMYKQTFGLVWVATLGVIGIICVLFAPQFRFHLFSIFSGISMLFGIFFLWLFGNHAIAKWIQLTMTIPTKTRNTSPKLLFDWLGPKQSFVLGVILISVVWIFLAKCLKMNKNWSALVLWLAAPVAALWEALIKLTSNSILNFSGVWSEWLPATLFLWLVGFIFVAIGGPNWSVWDSLSIAASASVAAGLLAQGYRGSSHAIWPLVFVLFAIAFSKILESGTNRGFFLAALAPILLTVFLLSSLISLQRYAWMYTDQPIGKRTTAFAWAGTPGPLLQDSEIAAELFNLYSKKGKTALFPGYEPVAFLTGRAPNGNVSSSDPATNSKFWDMDVWLDYWKIDYVIVRDNHPYTTGDSEYAMAMRDKVLGKKFEIAEVEKPFLILQRRLVNLSP